MVETMESPSSSNKVTAYFAHAELIAMILTALGAKNDPVQLLASNFEQQKDRQFRSSKLLPFASSFAAVKYSCSANAGDTSSSDSVVIDEPKIMLLLNHKPLDVPWCKDRSVCTLTEMWQMFKSSPMRSCPHGICGKEYALSKGLLPDTCTHSFLSNKYFYVT